MSNPPGASQRWYRRPALPSTSGFLYPDNKNPKVPTTGPQAKATGKRQPLGWPLWRTTQSEDPARRMVVANPYLLVPWYHGTMVPWYHGTVVPWNHGTMVPRYHGNVVPWCRGTMVPWYHGTIWGHVGVALGSLWCHFGVTLGLLWDHGGTPLGSHWDHGWIRLGLRWGHDWIHDCYLLGSRWDRSGFTLGLLCGFMFGHCGIKVNNYCFLTLGCLFSFLDSKTN